MLFDPLKFLDLSKNLANTKINLDTETITRTIIGRAYYSVFLHAREYLKEQKQNLRFSGTGKDHGLVENKLMAIDRQLGSTFRTLRENRNMSDYNLQNPAAPSFFSGFGRRNLCFNKTDQKDNIQLAEYITNNLPRSCSP